ncbi:MAG: hypothetical protein LBG96_01235 [Tannerella sp.]|nr:hypothetical protein [Tannerella sp.]
MGECLKGSLFVIARCEAIPAQAVVAGSLHDGDRDCFRNVPCKQTPARAGRYQSTIRSCSCKPPERYHIIRLFPSACIYMIPFIRSI